MNRRKCHAFSALTVLALLVVLPTCAQTTPPTEGLQPPEQVAPASEVAEEPTEVTEPADVTQAPTEPPTLPVELTLEQVLDHMEAARKKLTTFKATVVKAKRTEILKKVENATGTIQFKMPRLLRMELKSVPKGEETITIVGKTYAWVYRVYKKQATRATLKDFEKQSKDANPLEYGLARDIHELRKAYTLKLLPAEKVGKAKTLPIELTPIGARHPTDGTLIFWIDTTLWIPVQVREHKSSGETVETHTFSEIKLNKRIRRKTFEFTPPKGVEQFIN